jgi:hypothetical protein
LHGTRLDNQSLESFVGPSPNNPVGTDDKGRNSSDAQLGRTSPVGIDCLAKTPIHKCRPCVLGVQS